MTIEWLEQTLAGRIAESTTAAAAAVALEGQSLDVVVDGTAVAFRLRVRDRRLELLPVGQAAARATVHGTPLSLLGLLRGGDASALAASQARLGGDIETARAFARLLDALRPELEDELAYWVGDVLAHRAGSLLSGAVDFGRRLRRTFEANTAEYLQEEARELPAPQEVEALIADAEQLRDDVERAAWRLERLVRAMSAAEH